VGVPSLANARSSENESCGRFRISIRLTRALADGTLRFEPADVVRVKVFPVYVSMLYNCGLFLSLFGQHAHAVEVFQGAWVRGTKHAQLPGNGGDREGRLANPAGAVSRASASLAPHRHRQLWTCT
jgi:hypothetical protein